jgi:hypothetical protein
MERGLEFNMDRESFKTIITELSERLSLIEPYSNADLSDLGNEVGFILGDIIPNLDGDNIDSFITGFKHGVSLTNGTHF